MLRSRKKFPKCAGPLKRIGMKLFGCHPAIRTSGAARFKPFSRLFGKANINMLPIGNFPCWFAKENENSESSVESCLHWPSAFFELKKKHGWMFSCTVHARSRALSSSIRTLVDTLLGELLYAFFSAVKTHRYETIWLPCSHPYFRSRALFILLKALVYFGSTNIDMVGSANFPCWFAKENENAVSVVESHQHLPNAFFSLKNAWLDVFL